MLIYLDIFEKSSFTYKYFYISLIDFFLIFICAIYFIKITFFDFSFKRSLYSGSVNFILNTISFQSKSLLYMLYFNLFFYSSLKSFFIFFPMFIIPPANEGPTTSSSSMFFSLLSIRASKSIVLDSFCPYPP